MALQTARNSQRYATLSLIMIAGYGLFRSANSNIYLAQFTIDGSSFMFMTDFVFNAVGALTSIVVATVTLFLVHKNMLPALSIPIWPLAALFIACGVVAQSGFTTPLDPTITAITSAVVFSAVSVLFSLCWVELFAIERPIDAIVHLSCGTLVSVVLRHLLTYLPGSTMLAASLSFVIAGALCLQYARKSLPAVIGEEAVFPLENPPNANKRKALDELSDSLLAYCVLEAVIGLVNSFMMAADMNFKGSSMAPNIAMSIAAILFFCIAFTTQRVPRAATTFRIAFPVIAAMIVFVPFLDEGYSLAFSTTLLLSHDFMAILITYRAAHAANKHRVSLYGLLGFSSASSNMFLFVSFLLGTAFGIGDSAGVTIHMRFMVLACAAIYLLAMVLLFLSRNRNKKKISRENHGENIANTAVSEQADIRTCNDAQIEAPGNERPEPDTTFQATARRLAKQYGLTNREAEILIYLARGRTNTYIAEELVIAPTTVRGHIRNIYSKLNVHKRQELIDLFEQPLNTE